jgi:hypothetical protein
MCVALFIASGSFMGQPRILKALRTLPPTAFVAVGVLVVVPLVLMGYYMIRNRNRRGPDERRSGPMVRAPVTSGPIVS